MWRIDVVDLAVPNRISDLVSPSAGFLENLLVTNTQLQLLWPGPRDTFQSFLESRNVDAMFHALTMLRPSNITDRYNNISECLSFLESLAIHQPYQGFLAPQLCSMYPSFRRRCGRQFRRSGLIEPRSCFPYHVIHGSQFRISTASV
jgi:hypothetical protein